MNRRDGVKIERLQQKVTEKGRLGIRRMKGQDNFNF